MHHLNIDVSFVAEKNPTDKSYETLCILLNKLAKVDTSVLQNWLSKMIMGAPQVCMSLFDLSATQIFVFLSRLVVF